MIILDTNVISELIRKVPAPQVLQWFDQQSTQPVMTTAITVAELRYGVHSMPRGKRQQELDAAIAGMLEQQFPGNVLSFNTATAEIYGVLAASLRSQGIVIGQSDMMIAATTLQYNATLATRNTRHFVHCNLKLADPFSNSPEITSAD